jgi:D-alanyl-D-alanine carboxypeptidase
MKMRIGLSVLLVFMLVVVVFIAFRLLGRKSVEDASQELQNIVSKQVDKDIKNCVLAVVKGDGSFAWRGAAGIANQDGQVPMTGDTPIYAASITKLYTATVIMRLYEQGLVDIDDPMAEYLPEELVQGIHIYQGVDYSRGITIKQLLSHSSGIADYYSEKPEGGSSLYEIFMADPDRMWTVEQTIDRARNDLEPNFAPGTGTSYSDTNFQLLGKIIEAVTGEPLQAAYDEYIFQPLGLKHTWLVRRSEPKETPAAPPADVYTGGVNVTKIRGNGSYWADGGLITTPQEAIRFLQALKEGQIIRQDTLALMHDWHPLRGLPLQYGYGTMYFQVPSLINKLVKVPPLWGHSGSTGSFLYYSEDLDLYMAGTIDQTEDQMTPFIIMIKAMEAMR